MDLIHEINSSDKINVHTECPHCGKDLFSKKRQLELDNLKRKLQSTDLIALKDMEKIKDSFSTECCNLKMTYKINLKPGIRNVTRNMDMLEE